MESAKGDTFSSTIISDVLYGKEDGSELLASMDEIRYYGEIRNWTSAQWVDLLRKFVYSLSLVVRNFNDKPGTTSTLHVSL